MIKPRKILENLPQYEANSSDKTWRLKLDKNENVYGVSNVVLSSIKNMDFSEISKYPSSKKLIDKLSHHYNIKNEQLMLTNGFDEAIRLIISAYLDENKEIIAYEPIKSSILKYAQIQGSLAKEIKYSDFKNIENEISENTKIVFLEIPNSVTGRLVRASEIEFLIQSFQNVLFVMDCAYINFAQNTDFKDYLEIIERLDNVIIIKSFSSDFALAGLRLGFVASREEIINNLKKISTENNVDAIAIQCGYSTFSDEKYFEEIKKLNYEARELLYEGLIEKGFEAYKSEANFVLCDFNNYANYYYEKFRKNEVIVKKFPESSNFSSCLRITAAKKGGVKFLLELLNKKDILIFDPDCVIFDIQDSYNEAIMQTVRHFTDKEVISQEVTHLKNLGGYNHSYNIIKYLLENRNCNVGIDEIKDVFQSLYYAPRFLIDEEKLLIPKEIFEELSKKYDMVIYTDRTRQELNHLLEKFDINKYFYYTITSDREMEFSDILKQCPHKSVKYLCSNVQGIIMGNSANIETVGIIPLGSSENDAVNNFKHLGARYILKNVKYITEFLKRNEQNETALV